MHAPDFGHLAQALGGHCRYKTSLSPRLSEFAILCTARLWRAQYEWYAHAPIAEKAGVTLRTIEDLRLGRPPKSASKDERAIYDFVQELYKTRRVSDRTYKRVHALLDDQATVELVGIRLLRADFDDTQCIPDDATGNRQTRVRGNKIDVDSSKSRRGLAGALSRSPRALDQEQLRQS